jgi:Conjugal transfer protein TraD
LVALFDDDRATILGALLEVVGKLQADGQPEKNAASLKAIWRRKGLQAFDATEEKDDRPE